MANRKKEPRIAMESNSGHTVWLPQSQAAAFEAGQEASKRGELPKNYEQKVSEVLSLLKGSKK